MGRPAKDEYAQITEVARSIEQDLLTMAQNAEHPTVKAELVACSRIARHLYEKLPKVQTLEKHSRAGTAFAVIDPVTREVRPATYEEGMRLIMGYDYGNSGTEVLANAYAANAADTTATSHRLDRDPDGNLKLI